MKNDEEVAISVIQFWAEKLATVNGLGPGDNPDFEIIYTDGKYGVGEIKSDVHEPARAQWEAILKRKGSQIIELPEGLGAWTFRITPEAHVGQLENVLGEVVATLTSLGYEFWNRELTYPHTEFDSVWTGLGLIDFHRAFGVDGDYAYIQPVGVGGMVPTDSNMAIDWIESLLSEDDWQNSWTRLSNSQAEERHIFFWIDSNSPEDLRLRVTFHPDEPPSKNPILPDGITHLWVGVSISFQSHASAWLFRREIGWEAIKAPLANTYGLD
jgi:hypothetical protein